MEQTLDISTSFAAKHIRQGEVMDEQVQEDPRFPLKLAAGETVRVTINGREVAFLVECAHTFHAKEALQSFGEQALAGRYDGLSPIKSSE